MGRVLGGDGAVDAVGTPYIIYIVRNNWFWNDDGGAWRAAHLNKDNISQ